ncbi:Cyclic nucleotide-binding domain protein [Candidatus Magnetoovum chiemensis]|nr:Cyclic nucleotide-binding domain protein [Candidatus Magnetoovum chiemensis]
MGKNLFFGKYLIEKNLVTEEDILEALDFQKRNRPDFEKLAIKRSLLNMKQVFEILIYQADSDLSFEQAAQRKGYLSSKDVELIHNMIGEKKVFIGETLVQLGKISLDTLNTELLNFYKLIKEYHYISSLLKNINLFKNLDGNSLESLSYIAKMRDYAENEKVVSEGDRADSFYCVVSGSLKVTKNNPNPDSEEKEIYITNIEKNDIFGESCIFERGKRTANVAAQVQSTIIRFDKPDFIEFLKNHQGSSLIILVFIIQKLMIRLEFTDKELAYERKHALTQDSIDDLMKQFLN